MYEIFFLFKMITVPRDCKVSFFKIANIDIPTRYVYWEQLVGFHNKNNMQL